jgi:hypothetical protein
MNKIKILNITEEFSTETLKARRAWMRYSGN